MPDDTTELEQTQDPSEPVDEVMLAGMLQDIDQEIEDLKQRVAELEQAHQEKDANHAQQMADMGKKMEQMGQAHDQKFSDFTQNLQKTLYGA